MALLESNLNSAPLGIYTSVPNPTVAPIPVNTSSVKVENPVTFTSSNSVRPSTSTLPVNAAEPVESIRSLSVPSVSTLKCPLDPVSTTSAEVLPSCILSLEMVTFESMVPLNSP